MKNKIIEVLKEKKELTIGEIAYHLKRDRDIIKIELDEMIARNELLIDDVFYSLHEIKIGKIMTTKNKNLDNLTELLFGQLNKITAIDADINIDQCKTVSTLARDVIAIERLKLDDKKINLDFANHLVDHGDISPLNKLLTNDS